jgi:putative ABC transport system substrate-binding protein
MNRRRELLVAISASALAAPLFSFAQQQGKVWRIGFLSAADPSGYRSRVDALREGLRNFGYEEGKNLVIEFRWAEGKIDRLPELAAELVRLHVDVLVTHAAPSTRAAIQATKTIPIIIATGGDPVAAGFVASLAAPGGNVTGSTYFPEALVPKRLELIKDAFPHISRVGLLNDGTGVSSVYNDTLIAAARSVKIALSEFKVQGAKDFETAFVAMAKQRMGAVTVPDIPLFIANAKAIADLAIKQRLPMIAGVDFAEAGGILGYGANLLELYRRVGYFADKIFKGTKPGDLPIERPTKFELVVNTKTAKALGIKFPQSILIRADKVIE